MRGTSCLKDPRLNSTRDSSSLSVGNVKTHRCEWTLERRGKNDLSPSYKNIWLSLLEPKNIFSLIEGSSFNTSVGPNRIDSLCFFTSNTMPNIEYNSVAGVFFGLRTWWIMRGFPIQSDLQQIHRKMRDSFLSWHSGGWTEFFKQAQNVHCKNQISFLFKKKTRRND